LKLYATTAQHLLLLYYLNFGLEIDYTILNFLELDNENFLSLNSTNTYLLSYLFKQNNFPLFENLGLLEKIKSKVSQTPCSDIKEKISNILQLETSPQKFDIISAQKQTNSKFKEMHKILESLV
jgi:hypothetical protein